MFVSNNIKDMINKYNPEVVVSHDEKGEYGHGQHMLCTDFLKKAIDIKQDKEGKEHARKFLEHYCDINGLDANL